MTVCAVSTPAGCGGIAVVRLSGPDAIAIAGRVWKGKALSECASHTAHLGQVADADGAMLDQAVATVYRAPRSFTGEDVVEFSVHGSVYVQRALLASLVGAGAAIAEPGEFTRRAFVNGKLDLAEAEAVADIIASSSYAAHALAASQLQGRFSRHINQLRDKLIDLSALLELELDFSEEDVAFADRTQLRGLALQIAEFVGRLSATFESGHAIRRGVPVAIVGRPNAGKSSLLNELLGSDRAIVSDIPGTTRDTVEETVDIDGIMFRFIDTAGLRSTADPIERLGIERAYESIRGARIVLWLISPEATAAETEAESEQIKAKMAANASLITILSKADLGAASVGSEALRLSVVSGEGVGKLREMLRETASKGLPSDESMIVTNARHQAALLEAKTELDALIDGMDALPTDLLAEHLRGAINALGAITGQITSSDVLHTIFARFCVGK